MDKKIIIGVVIVIIAIIGIGAFALGGKNTKHAPDELVTCVAAHGEEPEFGFDPMHGWGYHDSGTEPLIQSTILKRDANNSFVNDLATNYTISSDYKEYTVNIRDDVKFTDGNKLTAKDVAFSYNKSKELGEGADLSSLKEVKAEGDTKVVFTLNKSDSTFINKLTDVGIVPEANYNADNYGKNPIGSGPYKLVQWDKGQQFILEKNPDYYGKQPYFKKITNLFLDPDAAFAAVKNGDVDIAEVPASYANQTVKGFHLEYFDSIDVRGISLPTQNNTGKTIGDDNLTYGNNVTADPAIREALNVGINRQKICDEVFSGHASPEFTSVDTRDFANPNAKVKDGDVAKAKQILKEGGWVDTDGDGIVEKDGVKASFDLYYPPDYLDRQSLATVFAEQAKDLGIEVNLQGADWDTIYLNMYSSAAVMQQTSPDPYKSIYQQYHSKEVDDFYMNPNLYSNSASDALMEQAMHSNNFDAANALWAQSALVNGGGWGPAGDAPWVWIANYNYNYFVKEDIDMGEQPDGLGNDFLINICEWTRTNSTA